MMEFNCPICGKLFVRSPKHLYKDGKVCYCSWTCYNHRDKKRKAHLVEQYTKSGKLIHKYQDLEQAATSVDGTKEDIFSACKDCTFYKGYLWRYRNDVS